MTQPVTIRLPVKDIQYLKEIAKARSFIHDKDITVSDLIKSAVEEYYHVPSGFQTGSIRHQAASGVFFGKDGE